MTLGKPALGLRCALAALGALCLGTPPPLRAQVPAAASAARIRIACVGDSITQGVFVDPSVRWTAILQADLGPRYDVENYGVSGTTLIKNGDSSYWKHPALGQALALQPNVVLIMLGTNDSKPQNLPSHPGEFQPDLKALVAQFTALPSRPKVWLVLPPPVFGDGLAGISEDVLAASVRPAIRAVAQQTGCPVIDLAPVLAPHPEDSRDRVHPTPAGHKLIGDAISAALLSPAPAAPAAAPAALTPGAFRQWGMDDLRHIDQTFRLPARGQYAESVTPGQPPSPDNPASMWTCGVELSALNAAARLNRQTYLPEVRRLIAGMDAYWVVDPSKGTSLGGYEIEPHLKPTDRYYDDNEWIVLDLADAYDLTRDPQILRKAKDTFAFVMSGEDATLGGGLYWHENEKNTKNACSNAPAVVGALRLYQITHDPADLAAARRLYVWTNAHLQDTDGLYFDSIGTDGVIHKDKWTYNTALMIRADALFYQLTHDKTYLAEARRVARAAEAHWVRPTGAIADEASFAHLLSESFLFLYDQDHDPHHLAVVRNALVYLHTQARSAAGDYGKRWDRPAAPRDAVTLLAEAAAPRAELVAAPYLDHAKARTASR